jgi:hypothetical protein
MQTPQTNPPHLAKWMPLFLLLIFAISFAIRVYRIDGQTLECEELYTVPAATGHQYVYLTNEEGPRQELPRTTSEHRRLVTPDATRGLSAVRDVLRRNVHLPLYFFGMHYWIEWFGTSEQALRLPSALLGALAVVMLFLLAWEMFTPLVAVVSSIFMAFEPEQIYFAQQARMYTLLAVLVVSSTYLLLLALRRPEKKLLYALYAVVSIAGLYTHYEYVFCLAGQTVFVWIFITQARAHWRRWLITQLAIALAFAPWALITLAQKKTSDEVIAWASGALPANLVLNEIVAKLAKFISVGELPFGWISVILGFVLLIIGVLAVFPTRLKLFLLACWIVFPIVGVLVMDSVLGTRGITITRYWMVVAPALYLLIGAGVDRLKLRPVQMILVPLLGGFLISSALLTAQGKLRTKPDQHRQMAQYVDGQVASSNNMIVLTEGLNALPLALGYYANHEMVILRQKWLIDQLPEKNFFQLIDGRPEVLLMVSGPGHAAKMLAENGFKLGGKPVQFGHVIVAKYVRSVPTPGSVGSDPIQALDTHR